MSLKTRIHGFTAWVNFRLRPYNQLMNNVTMDLLTGTNLKYLLLSLTGKELKRLDSCDGLTQTQKITRVEWVVDELKKCNILPDDVFVDCRMFAMRSAEQIFKLLWRLVCHDIIFVWERADYLMSDDDQLLTEVPFKWVPEPPPVKKKKVKTKKSLLSGFGASAIITEKIDEEELETDTTANYNPFPKSDFMKKFNPRYQPDGEGDGRKNFPTPEDCIVEMVNKQLQMTYEGRKLNVVSIDDLVDSRVLCALLNSFIPNTLTTEIFLNDRWTINMVLRTAEKMFYLTSPFDSEDLVEADKMSVCSFFCAFFMIAFKFHQIRAVVNWNEHLKRVVRDNRTELDLMPENTTDVSDTERQQQLQRDIDAINQAMRHLGMKYDLDFCYQWVEHVKDTVKELHVSIRQKMKQRFDAITVPRNITISDFCLSLAINLTLTNGFGFYKATNKETLSEGRRVILKNKETGEFIDDFTGRYKKDTVRKLLHLPIRDVVELNPEKYKKYEIYVESLSRNKTLRPNYVFLYQVFPGSTATWQKIFFKAIKDNEVEMVQRYVIFFRNNSNFLNCKEPQTGNSPLHWACKLGHYDIVLFLLESGANFDQKNNNKLTPLFLACEGLQRNVAHLMVEWGCDVHVRGPKNLTAFETIKNAEFKEFLIDVYQYYSTNVPKVMEGDTELLHNMIKQHMAGVRMFNNLRSRCINGSTLLHTAAYFGCIGAIKDLMRLGLDIDLLDYKGATALHRARDVETILVLMEMGANPSIEDAEGNTPLHVKCYGETGYPTELDAIDILLASGAKLTVRNNRGLMPIHCCAMQGRVDAIEMLLEADKSGSIIQVLKEETSLKPPSVVHLAIANDCVDCAEWLLSKGFTFKEGEQDSLVQKILSEQVKLDNRADAITFLFEHGANPNPLYPGSNTPLHYAAAMSGNTDVLETLIEFGADVDAVNDDGATSLFYACQSNNQFAASVLISYGANVRIKNLQGLTAFDFILDYDEWIECGYFSDEIRARLKAYSLKHARDLIRAISKKVKAPRRLWPLDGQLSNTRGQSQLLHDLNQFSDGITSLFMLPPIRGQHGALSY